MRVLERVRARVCERERQTESAQERARKRETGKTRGREGEVLCVEGRERASQSESSEKEKTRMFEGASASKRTSRVLQCVAVCCSVLQCVAVCCRVL